MIQKIQIPLLKDHHNHLSFYALLYDCLNLQAIKGKKDAMQLIMDYSSSNQNVSLVLGWNSSFYDLTREELENYPPVLIVNLSLHSMVMSPAAERMLKDDFPDMIENYRNPQWYEDHMPQVLVFLSEQAAPMEEKFRVFFEKLYQKGVYYIEEMQLPNERVFNVINASPFAGRTCLWASMAVYRALNPQIQGHIKGIKLFTDGALGSRSAAIKEPFLDNSKGYLLYTDESLYKALAEVASIKKEAAVHAIGELASAQVVRVVGQLRKAGIRFPGVRMEHCQFIGEETAAEAKNLGIVLSMQPNFSTDSIDYSDRLPKWYLENNNPFRMLIDQIGFLPGKDLIFGSDGMPHGAEAAIKASFFPPFPVQRLTVEEFTAGYCMPDKSYGTIEFEMDQRGLLSIKII